MKKVLIPAFASAVLLLGTNAHAETAVTHIPTLTYPQAKAIEEKALKAIAAHHIGGAVAVVDAAGNLIAFDRLDGSTLANVVLAPKKAYSAAAFGAPTDGFQQKVAQGSTYLLGNPVVIPLPGGLPIKIDGTVVGAIGVSTPDGNVDPVAAAAGLATN